MVKTCVKFKSLKFKFWCYAKITDLFSQLKRRKLGIFFICSKNLHKAAIVLQKIPFDNNILQKVFREHFYKTLTKHFNKPFYGTFLQNLRSKPYCKTFDKTFLQNHCICRIFLNSSAKLSAEHFYRNFLENVEFKQFRWCINTKSLWKTENKVKFRKVHPKNLWK